MNMLSVRVFPLDVTSYGGERVHKRFVRGSFVVANKVLKGVPGKKIRRNYMKVSHAYRLLRNKA